MNIPLLNQSAHIFAGLKQDIYIYTTNEKHKKV